MKFLIDISQRQSEKIQKYMDEGHYQSIGQFIITAIENQFSLEDGEADLNELIPTSQVQPHSIKKPLHFTQVLERYKISDMPNFYNAVSMPTFSQLVLSTQQLPEDKVWIWGQLNKLLPVKIGLRILQKNLGNNKHIELDHFLETAANEASEIGRIIKDYETKNNKTRNEKISTGLPGIDEASQSRYKYQFLAYLRKDGLLDGAMALLRLCNVEKRNGKSYIGLTQAGENLSHIVNPILDEGNLELSLSNAEISCYLSHVKQNVLSEYVAIKWILKKIDQGFDERSKLNTELTKDFGKVWNATDAVINTQRSGLLARVFELELIEKEKNGIYVTYSLSKTGKDFLLSN